MVSIPYQSNDSSPLLGTGGSGSMYTCCNRPLLIGSKGYPIEPNGSTSGTSNASDHLMTGDHWFERNTSTSTWTSEWEWNESSYKWQLPCPLKKIRLSGLCEKTWLGFSLTFIARRTWTRSSFSSQAGFRTHFTLEVGFRRCGRKSILSKSESVADHSTGTERPQRRCRTHLHSP